MWSMARATAAASSTREPYDPVAWRDGRLWLLDQTLLPAETRYIPLDTVEAAAEAITTMRVRGAPAIGVTAAYALAVVAGSTPSGVGAAVEEAGRLLGATRPTAVNLRWALDRVAARVAASASDKEAREAALDEARTIHREQHEADARMAELGAALFPPATRVLTLCNTGPLATAASYGTALGVLQAANQRHGIEVVVSETRPLLQGGRLTTWELAQWGVPFTLITDSMAADRMRRGHIDAVIVGADRIAANGDVANKIGTYSHAVAAGAHGLPFYVAAPLSTIDFDTPNGDAIPIEERATEEVHGYGDWRWSPSDAPVANPAFDVTPHERVTAIITEHGVHRPPFEESLGRFAAAPEAAA